MMVKAFTKHRVIETGVRPVIAQRAQYSLVSHARLARLASTCTQAYDTPGQSAATLRPNGDEPLVQYADGTCYPLRVSS